MNIASRRMYHWLAAIASGVLLVLSFPQFDYSFLAWIALAPLLLVLTQAEQTLRRAFALGWVTGFVFFFFSCNWITHSMIRYGGMNVVAAYAVAALFTAITGLFPALFALLTTHLVKTIGLWATGFTPVLWVATEWLRAIVTGVTWNALGLSQVDSLVISRFAQIGGVSVISFVIAAVSVAIVLLPEFKAPLVRHVLAGYCLLGLLAIFASKSDSTAPLPPREILVAAVQPNLPVDILTHPDEFTQRNVSGLATNLQLTRDAINQTPNKKADLIVWAESPLVLNYEQDEVARTKLNALAKEYNAHLLFSALGRDGEQIYNSVQTITPEDKALKRYDKMRLVPFGEYVPLRAMLGYFVPAMIGDFTPGNTATVNSLKLATEVSVVQNDETKGEVGLERTTKFIKVGTFICYEAAYPNLVRQFVNNGAALLINVSDDAWFGNSAGAAQHLNHARMRAIENNRDIMRVTNSGISALLTASGEVVDPLPMFTAASKVWKAEEHKELTLYAQYGDWFTILCVVISAIAIGASFVYHSRAPKKSQI